MSEKLTREREDVILRAAQRRFAAYGYSKVTMDEIADDIGMAKASLYYYFPTKEAIFRAVVRHEQEEFLAGAKSALRQTEAAELKLIQYVQHRLKLAERLNNLSHTHQDSWHDVKPVFKELFSEFSQRELRCVTQILQDGNKAGQFHAEHPQRTAQMILHVLHGLHMRLLRMSPNYAVTPEERGQFEEEAQHFVSMILHGIVKQK